MHKLIALASVAFIALWSTDAHAGGSPIRLRLHGHAPAPPASCPEPFYTASGGTCAAYNADQTCGIQAGHTLVPVATAVSMGLIPYGTLGGGKLGIDANSTSADVDMTNNGLYALGEGTQVTISNYKFAGTGHFFLTNSQDGGGNFSGNAHITLTHGDIDESSADVTSAGAVANAYDPSATVASMDIEDTCGSGAGSTWGSTYRAASSYTLKRNYFTAFGLQAPALDHNEQHHIDGGTIVFEDNKWDFTVGGTSPCSSCSTAGIFFDGAQGAQDITFRRNIMKMTSQPIGDLIFGAGVTIRLGGNVMWTAANGRHMTCRVTDGCTIIDEGNNWDGATGLPWAPNGNN